MIGHHLSISPLRKVESPAGVCCSADATSRPSSVKRAFTVGSASDCDMAALSFSMASFEVPLGAKKPNQPDMRKPGTPPSADVGISGIDADRCGDRFAIALI